MMKTNAKLFAVLCSSLMGCMASSIAVASVSFSDSIFNFSDYSISNIEVGDTMPADITANQISAGGNPGSALQVGAYIGRDSEHSSLSYSLYIMNRTFRYDPSVQGAIASIDASVDGSGQLFIDGAPAPYNPVASGDNGEGVLLIFQAENFYTNLIGVATPPRGGTGGYSTLRVTDLKATDFGLVTDLPTFTVDKTQHPNFSSGVIEIGISEHMSFNYPTGMPDIRTTAKYDNLHFTVTSIPEPEAYAMLLVGLGVVGFLGRQKNKSRRERVSAE